MNNPFRPYNSDIKQIESLVSLGCNENDICKVLGITPNLISKWKDRIPVVNDLLKPKARPEYTLLHPDYAPLVEEVFTCAGKRYYRFKDEYRMSTGRYKYYYATLKEIEMKLSLDNLNKYVAAFEDCLNGTGKKKAIEIGKLWELVINLKSKISLSFDVNTVKKLAAIAYFDESEDLTTYNDKYGKEKIELWDQYDQHDFFLTRRIGELLNVSNISDDSLAEHLKEIQNLSKQIDYNLATVLEEISSESGKRI